RGDISGAQQRLEQVRALAKSTDNRADQAAVLANLGVIRTHQGALREALRWHDQSIAINRELEDRDGTGLALSFSADTLALLGNLNAARNRYEEGLEAIQQSANRQMLAHAYGGLSRLASEQVRLAD